MNELKNNKILVSNNTKAVRNRCEIWSRVVGYLRPTSRWNSGKEAEFEDRVMFTIN